jgi:hypothetical protein
MKPRLFGTAVALVAVLATVTCKDDPTATLSGAATRILISPNPVFLSEGGTGNFTAQAVNDALRPIPSAVTATSGDINVVTVAANNDNPDPSGATQVFDLAALVPGQVLVTVNAAGLSAQDTVNVLPLSFAGVGSTASPQVGQPFTLNSTAVLKFDATSDIDFGEGVHGIITSNTPDVLTVIVPQPEAAQPGPLTVSNVAVTFAPGSLFDLPTASLFNVVNPYDPNDTCGAGVAVGEGEFYDGFASGEADNYYKLTVPAGGAVVDFLLQWDGAADIDVLMLDAACGGFIGGFGGATGNNPEDFSMVLPAGTHNLLINLYDAHDDVPHLYKMTINIP